MMNLFKLDETPKIPKIEGNIEEGTLLIIGKSIPEDAHSLYYPFHEWLQNFYSNAPENVEVIFDLEYFNTSTSKIILTIMLGIKGMSKNRNIDMTWVFEADDFEMEEAGLDYQLMVGDILKLKSKEPL